MPTPERYGAAQDERPPNHLFFGVIHLFTAYSTSNPFHSTNALKKQKLVTPPGLKSIEE
jgi:hypothetical protein